MAESEASIWLEDESESSYTYDVSKDGTYGEYFEDDTEDERGEISCDETGKTSAITGERDADEELDSSHIELIRTVALSLFSTVLFAVFVLFAAVTSKDNFGVSWVLFFSFNAAMPVIFLIYWVSCFPIFAIHILAMINGMWSIIYLMSAATKGQDEGTTMKDMSIQDTTTSAVLMQQNSIITMASIGFFSSMYHSLLAELFLDTKKIESEKDKERAKNVSVATKKMDRERQRKRGLR